MTTVVQPAPDLWSMTRIDEPRAHVLFLHGGQEDSHEPVRRRNASWWRMALLGLSVSRRLRRRSVSADLLKYSVRGWNDPNDPSPVGDALWALDRIAARDERPIIIVGHSMGGRTACRVASHPSVVGVIGLAPWLPQGEPVDALAARHLYVLHGSKDSWTSPQWSENFVDRCRPLATATSWTSLPGAGHFMFSSVSTWNRFVADSIDRIVSA